MRNRLRRIRVLVAVLFSTLLLTGCEFDVYSLPLPGGADVGEDPITVTVEFNDVLDLVPQSSVKYNEVDIGRVTDVELGGEDGRTARVTLLVRNDTGLPANARANIRQTSLLGEKFVSFADPTQESASGELADGDLVPLARTGRNPEVEEVLGALSLILNGGGVAQLRTIAKEVNLALEGREENVKSALRQVRDLMSQLDQRKGDIIDALESVNRLAKQVRAQQDSIDLALEELPSAVLSLDRQREDLVSMLQGLNRLGDVGVRVIRQTEDVTIESLEQLFPVLNQLSNSGDNLANSIEALVFPFIDAAVGRDPQVARNLHMGDYVNLDAELEIDLANPQLPTICLEPINDALPCDEVIGPIFNCIEEGLNDPSACTSLPQEILQGVAGDQLCQTLQLPVVCGGNTGGGGNGGGGNGGGGTGGGGTGGNGGGLLPNLGNGGTSPLDGLLRAPLQSGGGR
ncbi:MCE family protein [Nocardioides panacisoli]|uniref:MCE family protein n=1 Tax=Nocardioides panacisoli TaxID=627624 RepID=UPI001C63279F|nr:MCE family protein [Nocardioides panacisoli]QYJ03850.1 MCE family protein [Nocardioides panacisoli]